MSEVHTRYRCIDCGVRLWKPSRDKKHRDKTGHRTEVNHRATRAAQKYRDSQRFTYLDRLISRDEALYERGFDD